MKSQKVCPNEYEHQYWPLEKVIVGIDEAGRGPLAGPLTVVSSFPLDMKIQISTIPNPSVKRNVMRYLNRYKKMHSGLKSFR